MFIEPFILPISPSYTMMKAASWLPLSKFPALGVVRLTPQLAPQENEGWVYVNPLPLLNKVKAISLRMRGSVKDGRWAVDIFEDEKVFYRDVTHEWGRLPIDHDEWKDYSFTLEREFTANKVRVRTISIEVLNWIELDQVNLS